MNGDLGIEFLGQETDFKIFETIVSESFRELIDCGIGNPKILSNITDRTAGDQFCIFQNIVCYLFLVSFSNSLHLILYSIC